MTAEIEFSRLFHVESFKQKPHTLSIEANEEECQALAERFGILKVKSFKADLKLKPGIDDIINLSGTIQADVSQQCVISGDQINISVTAPLNLDFSESHSYDHINDVDEVDFQEEQPPEPIENGVIDLGEVTSQYLSMELDPYPRTPGLAFDDYSKGNQLNEDEKAPHPFAALAELKDKLK